MKSFYDLKKEEQKKLKKEFRKKWGSIRNGIIIDIFLCIPFIAIEIYAVNTYNEDLYKSSILWFILISIVVMIIVYIIESNAFNKWLKSRNILK